jgi:hypothetical protein
LARAGAAQQGWTRTRREQLEQALGPEVLMDVRLDHRLAGRGAVGTPREEYGQTRLSLCSLRGEADGDKQRSGVDGRLHLAAAITLVT